MKITGIETISLRAFPDVLWVQVHTDAGLIGLGETFWAAQTVAMEIHELIAPYLIGKDPLQIDHHNRYFLNHFLGFRSVGVEMRAASAIDIALWDVFGQAVGQPIYQLLGGRARDSIPVYNTCAGYDHVRTETTADVLWEVRRSNKPYDDRYAFLHHADELAASLVEEGYGGMKIWPFDEFAAKTAGTHISKADLKKALEPFEKIRKSVGDKIEIHVELHSLWNLPAALRIAEAVRQFDPFWIEDPMKMDNLDALANFTRQAHMPVAASETLGTRWAFRELFAKEACTIAMLDVGWTGGISEARKIASMAEAHQLAVAPHDCVGPVQLAASVHLAQHLSNTLVQEVVRAFYFGWYQELVTDLPPLDRGSICATDLPGIGTRLRPEVKSRADATVRRTGNC